MTEPHPFAHLLTASESQQVDAALLTSRDRFSVRVALYGLRILQQVATAEGMPLETLNPDQIQTWLRQDTTATAVVLAQSMEMDDDFQAFWAKLLWSSIKPLQQAAIAAQVSIPALTLPQVIQYFEHQAQPTRSDLGL